MKNSIRLPSVLAALSILVSNLSAQTGPFDPEAWPPTINPGLPVDYVVTDGGLQAPSGEWFSDALLILSGGDQGTADTTIGGHVGRKVVGGFLNVADLYFEEWADDPVIDILVQVYGNEALLNAAGEPRDFTFLTGVLPELNFPVGGQIPVEANNKKWNWVLFRIANDIRESDGSRYVGSVPDGAQGNTAFGGVNGGTIRFESVGGLIVRVVAFGPQGAFGEPEQINQFFPPDSCDPEPETNLVGIDIAGDVSDHLIVLNDGDQTVTYQDNVGPAGDARRAVAPTGSFLNFGITDEYLGKPCNDPRSVKVCVEFYDDPAFAGAGVRFGPEVYATDNLGGTGVFPVERRHVMQGTGQWIRRSWTVPAVSLQGVNADGYTAGPRFISENGAVYVSSFQLAVLRTGDHVLAGIDPLEDCFEDPTICEGIYGNYAELDLGNDIRDGLDVGNSGGDQEMIVAEAGPLTDRRQAVRPALDDGSGSFNHNFLNFAILDEPFGPTSQPPALLAICVTYYDDPNLIGARFKPAVYSTEINGVETYGFTDDSYWVTVEGTDQWRTAYWEIPRMKFSGVNQGPQAAARFELTDKVFFTSVRYAVIRPCGEQADVNLLEDCKPVNVEMTIGIQEGELRLVWPTSASGAVLQETPDLINTAWSAVTAEPSEENGFYVVQIPIGTESRFYRLLK